MTRQYDLTTGAPTSSKVWIVTGASQGLGLCMALAALKAGHRVIACARNVEKAREEHPAVEAHGGRWLKLDVSSSDTTEIVRKAVEEAGGVDVVVNNAGYFQAGTIEDLTEDEILGSVSTHFMGPIRVLKGALPSMRERKSGTVVYISSIFGFIPSPGAIGYNSTRAASDMLHETLKVELAPFNIRSIILTTGLYRTNVLKNSSMPAQGINPSYIENTVIGPLLGTVGAMIAEPESMPGDPEKFGERVVELVDRTGHGKDLEGHDRIFMGRDGLEMGRKKIDQLSSDLEASKEIGASTDYEGHTGRGVAPVVEMQA